VVSTLPFATPLEDRHVPRIAKQPPVILKPTLDVEVAEPLMLSPATVVVPNPVEETVSLPFTSNSPDGLTVPTPTVPRKYDVAVVVAIMFPTVS